MKWMKGCRCDRECGVRKPTRACWWRMWKVVFVSGEAEARLINKQVGCQAGAQSEEGAFVAQLAVR